MMFSVFPFLLSITLVLGQLRHPDSTILSIVTPTDVVNILIPGSGETENIVASVVTANDISTVYALECAGPGTQTSIAQNGFAQAGITCVIDLELYKQGVTVTQGQSSMIWSYSAPADSDLLNAGTQACAFSDTTALTAVCVHSLGFGTFTQGDMVETVTYKGRIEKGSVVGDGTLNGPPPFVPVRITAGLEKILAVTTTRASVTTPLELPSETRTGAVAATTSKTSNAQGKELRRRLVVFGISLVLMCLES